MSKEKSKDNANSIFSDLKFCSLCDHAVSKEKIELMKFDYVCSYCGNRELSRFYSFGSQIHKERWEDFINGKSRDLNNVRLLPVAFKG